MIYPDYKKYFLILIIFIVFSLGFFLGDMKIKEKAVVSTDEIPYEFVGEFSFSNSKRVETHLVAIDTEGEGIFVPMITEIRDGEGLVLVNIDDVLADVNAQYSARIAKKVVENLSGVNLNKTDIVFNIKADAKMIGGQSAATSMALSVYGLINDDDFNQSVIATGSLLENGTILDATNIFEKSKAAKENNISLILVPIGKGSGEVKYEKIRKCGTIDFELYLNENFENREYCETKFEEKKLSIGEDIGIGVVEVKNLEEAINYYFV